MKVRRVVLAALAYFVGALVVDRLIAAMVPLFVLPALTITLGRGLLLLGLVVTLAAAWSYEPASSSPGTGSTSDR